MTARFQPLHCVSTDPPSPFVQVNTTLMVLDVSDNRLSDEAKGALIKQAAKREELVVVT